MSSIPDWEDPTCFGAAKPMHHSRWTWAPEPGSHNCWVHGPQLLRPVCPEAREQGKPSRHSYRVAPARHDWRRACTAAKTQHWHKSIKKINNFKRCHHRLAINEQKDFYEQRRELDTRVFGVAQCWKGVLMIEKKLSFDFWKISFYLITVSRQKNSISYLKCILSYYP